MKWRIGLIVLLVASFTSAITWVVASSSGGVDPSQWPAEIRPDLGIKVMSMSDYLATFPPEDRIKMSTIISKEIELAKANKPKDVPDDYLNLPADKDLITVEQARELAGWNIKLPAYLPKGARLRGAQPQPYGQPEGAALFYAVGDKSLVIELRRPLRSQTIFIKEKFNAEVGEQPAVFMKLRTTSGKSWEELTWTKDGLVFGVYGDLGRDELIKVAESL